MMFIRLITIVLCSVLLWKHREVDADAVYNAKYHQIGSFSISHPSFVSFHNWESSSSSTSPSPSLNLFVTQFTGNPFKSSTISRIDDMKTLYESPSDVQIHPLNGISVKWPNVLTDVPSPSPSPSPHLLLGDGFLVPLKNTGGMYLLRPGQGQDEVISRQLSPKRSGHFYHKGIWKDMNGDGLLDVITARAHQKSFFSKQFIGELVWFENDGNSLDDASTWTEHIVCQGIAIAIPISVPLDSHACRQSISGPDVLIEVVELDGNKDTIEVYRMA